MINSKKKNGKGDLDTGGRCPSKAGPSGAVKQQTAECAARAVWKQGGSSNYWD